MFPQANNILLNESLSSLRRGFIMKKILCLMLLASALIACERQDRAQERLQTEEDSDNTGRNVRDRNSQTITPLDQSENDVDRKITQQIRQALMSDDSLSVNAKNIKIITI